MVPLADGSCGPAKERIGRVIAMHRFFETPVPGYPIRPITLGELKQLTKEDRVELGTLCAKELGCEIEE